MVGFFYGEEEMKKVLDFEIWGFFVFVCGGGFEFLCFYGYYDFNVVCLLFCYLCRCWMIVVD